MSYGNEARVVARQLAEDGADGRREGVDVGHHHDHVARMQRPPAGRVRQPFQQLVVQDLDLALRAVRDVEDDGAVGRVQPRGARQRRMLVQRHEVADARLHLLAAA